MTFQNNIEECCARVGEFLYHFAALEHAIDYGIGILLKIEPAALNIIAANIDFARKVSILFSVENLLGEMPEQDRKTLLKDTRSAIMEINDQRKMVAHCSFSPSPDGGAIFRRAVAVKELRIEDVKWSVSEFKANYKKINFTKENVRRLVTEMQPYVPKLDFSDPRNSMYVPLLFQ